MFVQKYIQKITNWFIYQFWLLFHLQSAESPLLNTRIPLQAWANVLLGIWKILIIVHRLNTRKLDVISNESNVECNSINLLNTWKWPLISVATATNKRAIAIVKHKLAIFIEIKWIHFNYFCTSWLIIWVLFALLIC